jgi:coenzyme F420-dependent glucose-6-phosphate dehydrogenase
MPKMTLYNAAYTDDADAAVKVQKKYWAGTMIHATYLQNIYTPEMAAANGAVVGDDTVRNSMCISTNQEEHARFAQATSTRASTACTYILPARTSMSS